jgi:hypothetical protein
LHVKDVIAPVGVTILDDPEGVVFSVEQPKSVEDLVAPPAEGELQEPEVIKEKKEGDEEEAAPEEKEAPKAKEEKKEDKKDKK